MQAKLYVGNLSYNVSEDELRGLFSQAGEIKEIVLITDRETQRRKGFGFVEMVTQTDAEKAIRMFNDQDLGGRRLTVSLAKPREDNRGDGRSRSRY
jgi:RNA recognition motif-containing protein